MPLIVTDAAAERCCEVDSIGQAACDWLRAASDPVRAGRVARLAVTIKAAASPLLRGNLVTEEAWAGMQAVKHMDTWPLLAEFEVGDQGGKL
eukprot:93079-Alexandrium_andersonii.AAC.1